MARHGMDIAIKERFFDFAKIFHKGAPRLKAATRRNFERTWDFAHGQETTSAPCARVKNRYRRKEEMCIRVTWRIEYLLCAASLYNLAEQHHDNSIGDMPHDAQIMSDEKIGKAEALLKLHQQVEDLSLNR